MYESGCAFSPRTNFVVNSTYLIGSYNFFCKHTTLLCNKPTIAISSACASVSS